jgi:protein phosphatase
VSCDARLEYACVSEIGDRTQNQDRFLVLSDSENGLYLFAVADGMGGHRAGAEAAEVAVNSLREQWQESQNPGDIQQCIRSLFKRAHISVRQLANPLERSSPQTTLTLLLVAPGEAWSGHVGDTRAIHYSNTEFRQRTRDHSVTEQKLASGKITEQQAAFDRDRNLLTMALGGAQEPNPDITQWRIAPGDIICLASDGAWSLLSGQDFVLLCSAHDLQQTAGEVMARRLSRAPPGQDNATLVAVRRLR